MNRSVHKILGVLLLATMTTSIGCGGGSSSKKKARPAPTGAMAWSDSSGEIEITWNSVAGASTYDIYRDTSTGVTKATGTLIAGVLPPYTDAGLTNGTTYYYVVTAGGTESPEVSAMPLAAPTGLSATAGTSAVTLNWGIVTGATSYILYWSTNPGLSKTTGSPIVGASSPYSHTGLSNATTYFYVVTAANSVGGGAESSASGAVSAMPLDAPTGVTATPTGSGKIMMDWNSVTGASSYNLYWDTAPGVTAATGSQIAGVSPPYLHSGLVDRTAYYYVVTAVNPFGGGSESIESAEASGTPDVIGTLDPGFDGRGFTSHADAAGDTDDDEGNGIVVDAVGRILVTGGSQSPTTGGDMVIWRFNGDGTLDTTFNGQGWVTHDNAAGGTGFDEGNGIALDSTGRIVVTGWSRAVTGGQDMAVWRFLADGTVDTTFNGQGWVTHNSAAGGNSTDSGLAVTLDAMGNIVVVGYSLSATTSHDMAVWRFLPDGTLDAAFNGQGWVTHAGAAGGTSVDRGWDTVLDSSGRIVVAGDSRNTSNNYDMAIWRFNADGTLDTTFNGQGWAVHDDAAGGTGNDFGRGVSLDASGRIVVAGYSESNNGSDMAIWRFNADGTPDTTFNGQGWVTHNQSVGGNDNDDEGHDVVIDGAGRILVTGYARSLINSHDMVIWRFNPTGSIETTFGNGGVLMHNNAAGGNRKDFGNAIALDASGRILVAGASKGFQGNFDMAVWRVE
ncbi:MAG: hypothetical protein O7H41_19535 [Planctomycetota bacterium]|nr:hypothetical protein [Planctomycetota bacterium]